MASVALSLVLAAGSRVVALLLLAITFCWRSRVEVTARDGDQDLPNIIMVKPHKVGGSTMGGIVRRIASRHGGTPAEYTHKMYKKDFFAKKWNVKTHENQAVRMHIWANHGRWPNLVKDSDQEVLGAAYRFTLTRDPVDRCLSQFYFDSLSGAPEAIEKLGLQPGKKFKPNPTGEDAVAKALIRYLPDCKRNSVFEYVRLHPGDTVQEVLDSYDLVGVMERWIDTVAVLMIDLGVSYGDVLHLSTNRNDGNSTLPTGEVVAKVIRPPVSEEPQSVIDAISARPETVKDLEFWVLANARLDDRIEELKSQGFLEVRDRLEKILLGLKDTCEESVMNPQKPNPADLKIWLMSRKNEKYNESAYFDCYWGFNGCGIKCMDKFTKDRSL